MTMESGTKLGRYEIRAKIGEGGMGEVYLAQNTKLDRKAALRIPPAELATNQDRMRRFTQEAKAEASLRPRFTGSSLEAKLLQLRLSLWRAQPNEVRISA